MKQFAFPTRSRSLTALAVLLLISGSLAGCSSDEEGAGSGQTTPTTNAQAGGPPSATAETVYISAEHGEHEANTDLLVKSVDDVFVGTILSAGETFSLYENGAVWTSFAVAVEQRLLGSVEGTITVVQMGGFDPERNVLELIEGAPLLEVGETYMLATRTSRNSDRPEWDGQHVVQHGKGMIRVRDEAHRQQLLQEYTDAITRAGLGS